MGLNVVGTLSIIYEAINTEVLNENFREVIKVMRENNIWISEEILNAVEKG